MDGVVHPNVEQAIGRDRIRKALKRYENRPADEHRYGIVRSVNEDGSYEVLLDGDVQTSRCAQYGTALVGDRVLAVTKKDGRNDLIGRLGGEIGGGGTVVTKVDDVSNYVAGRVFAHAGTNDPAGSLLCDGRAVSRREYWELFDAIGTTYGAGDGSSTFNLPNIESRTIIGESDSYALGATGGEESHALTAEENGPHSHNVKVNVNAQTQSFAANVLSAAGYEWTNMWTGSGHETSANNKGTNFTEGSGYGTPHNNMQPYIVMRYFITTGKGDPASGINPADYPVDRGVTDGWVWKKWASGEAECWKSVKQTVDITTTYNAYASFAWVGGFTYPIEFSEVPSINCTPTAGGVPNVSAGSKALDGFSLVISNPAALSAHAVEFDIHIKGKWKKPSASGGTETIAPTIAERFEKLEVDYIVAHGTSGIWTWRKWASGVAECWGEVSKLQTLNNAWGNLYTAGSGYFTRQSYPFAFSDRPQEIVTGHWPDNLSWVAAESGSGLNTTTQSAEYNVIRNGDASGYTGTSYLHLYVIGRWR